MFYSTNPRKKQTQLNKQAHTVAVLIATVKVYSTDPPRKNRLINSLALTTLVLITIVKVLQYMTPRKKQTQINAQTCTYNCKSLSLRIKYAQMHALAYTVAFFMTVNVLQYSPQDKVGRSVYTSLHRCIFLRP